VRSASNSSERPDLRGGDDLNVTLRLLSERYNYLAVYWLDASSAGSPRRVGLLLAGSLAVVGSGLLTWLFTLTGGLARLFLSAVAGVFVLSLALGVFFVAH